jgi:hypothetical protein
MAGTARIESGRASVYAEALRRIMDIAKYHHNQQQPHLWLHALTVDIPAIVDAALGPE